MKAQLLTAPAERAALAPLIKGSGLELRSEGDWAVLVDRESPPRPGSARHPLRAPGLWRAQVAGSRESAERVFELPPLAGDPAPLVAWAHATRRGTVPPDWTPPPPEDVEAWVPADRRSVRAGVRVVNAELLHPAAGSGRLALVFPELVRVPPGLPDARAAWLTSLLAAMGEHWRLVRVGLDPETHVVSAEVDLTGVPEPFAGPLVQLSLEALRGAVEWALASLSFLADAHAPSRALERHP